jgi:hypothetical protein
VRPNDSTDPSANGAEFVAIQPERARFVVDLRTSNVQCWVLVQDVFGLAIPVERRQRGQPASDRRCHPPFLFHPLGEGLEVRSLDVQQVDPVVVATASEDSQIGRIAASCGVGVAGDEEWASNAPLLRCSHQPGPPRRPFGTCGPRSPNGSGPDTPDHPRRRRVRAECRPLPRPRRRPSLVAPRCLRQAVGVTFENDVGLHLKVSIMFVAGTSSTLRRPSRA